MTNTEKYSPCLLPQQRISLEVSFGNSLRLERSNLATP